MLNLLIMKLKTAIKKASSSVVPLLVLLTFSIAVSHAAGATALSPAGGGGGENFGGVAKQVTSTFQNIAKLIVAISYLAGLGFAIGAILKFKQHKDNPQQIPVGTPIALVFIAAALLFLPSILTATGYTLFSSGGSVGGWSGSNLIT